MSRLWRALAGALMGALFAVMLTAGAASAAPIGPGDPCQNDPVILCGSSVGADSDLLPVNRWGTATGTMHSRLSENAWEDIPAKIQRNGTYPVLMSLGNAMWSGGTGMTSAAIQMNILNSAGEAADNAAGTLGHSLVSSGVLALVAVIAIGRALWKVARGQGGAPWATLAKTAATVGLFVVMVAGASASTTTSAGVFQPGKMSPGWFVVTTNSVLSSLASAPAAAMTSSETGAGFTYDATAKGDLSCAQYVTFMKKEYATANPITKMSGSIPLVMSGMWEATGMEVWATSQFGAENPYGDFAYCRLLEQQSGTPPALQRTITRMATDNKVADESSLGSLAWETVDSNQEDRTMVAWAQCRPTKDGNWQLADGWEKVTANDGRDPAEVLKNCADWWAKPAAFHDGDTFADGQSGFNWDNAKEIKADSGDPRVKDYLLTLQGRTGVVSASLAMVYCYVFSSVIMLVVFGLISGAIIVAKVAALVMMLATFIALLVSLLGEGKAGSSIGKFFGQYVGMSLFVFGIQLIFAFLTLITSMMVKAGNDMFGPGSIISMIWTGFSPVVAVIVLHMIFTKFLKVPSPFSLTGAQQWGAAASGGAMGGAVGAGVMSRMNQLRSRGESAVLRSGGRAGIKALNTVTNGRLGRGAKARPGAITTSGQGGGNAAGAVVAPGASNAGRRGARGLANEGAAATVPLTPEQKRAAKNAANLAAAGRGAKNTVAGRYTEGVKARIRGAEGAFGANPVGSRWDMAKRIAGGTVRGGAKAVGAGALIVGTGGLAAPVMAAVWGKNRASAHLSKVRSAREGAIGAHESRQAADTLARKKAADRAKTLEPAVRSRQTAGRTAAVSGQQAPQADRVDGGRTRAGESTWGASSGGPRRSNGETAPASSSMGLDWSSFGEDTKPSPAEAAVAGRQEDRPDRSGAPVAPLTESNQGRPGPKPAAPGVGVRPEGRRVAGRKPTPKRGGERKFGR